MDEYASESGHWYQRDGTPAYKIRARNGLMRNTTLRDARKLKLVPSVTTITSLAAAPQLSRWMAEQYLLMGLTMPRRDYESERDWFDRIWAARQEVRDETSGAGTKIHGALERSFLPADDLTRQIIGAEDPVVQPFVDVVRHTIDKFYPGVQWETEKSFASPHGYGGKVDLHSRAGLVLDFKTKDSVANQRCYDNHFMQTAAYAQGLGMPEARCAVIFVSRTHPAEALLVEHSQEDTIRGWRQFLALRDYYYAKTGLEL